MQMKQQTMLNDAILAAVEQALLAVGLKAIKAGPFFGVGERLDTSLKIAA